MKLRTSNTPVDTNENCSQCGQALCFVSEYYWIQDLAPTLSADAYLMDEAFCSKECATRFSGEWF